MSRSLHWSPMTHRSGLLRTFAGLVVLAGLWLATPSMASGRTARSVAQRSNVTGLTSARFVNSFVRRDGSRLTVAGHPFRFTGANGEFLGLENYGPIPSDGHGIGEERYATQFEIDDELATAHEMGASVIG